MTHIYMLIIYDILTSLLVLYLSFRWGNETSGRHGGFLSGPDNYSPGHVIPHKWERCTKLDKQLSWAYRKNIELTDIMSTQVITYCYTALNMLNIGIGHKRMPYNSILLFIANNQHTC